MKIKGFITVGVLLGLSGGIIVGARASSYERDQEEEHRPKFYALQVVLEKNVQNAKDSLGVPDGRYAEILPGGQLVLRMEKDFIDSGKVVCKGEEDYALEGFFRMQDTLVEQQDYAWMFIHREPLNRFDFLGGEDGSSGMGVNMNRVTNIGTKSMFVDSIIGYGLEAGKNW